MLSDLLEQKIHPDPTLNYKSRIACRIELGIWFGDHYKTKTHIWFPVELPINIIKKNNNNIQFQEHLEILAGKNMADLADETKFH